MLRRITAAAFTLAALSMSIGATSAHADDYGPDEFLCTIVLSDSVVVEGTPVDVTVSCTVDTTGTVQLIDEDGGIVDTAEMTVAGSDTATMNGAAGETAVADPAVVNVVSAYRTAALHTAAGPAEVVAMEEASGAFEGNDDDPATLTMVDLKAGDYTVRYVDSEDADLADPAAFTVLPAGHEPDGDGLAVTGATGLPYLAVAGGLLLVGIAALVVTRRARGKA